MKPFSLALGLLLCFCWPGLASEEFEQITLQALSGDLITIPLELEPGADWEYRIITPGLIEFVSNRRFADHSELLVRARDEGLGRVETVRIVSNRVKLRRYVFVEISRQESARALTNQRASPEIATKSEDLESQELDRAIEILEDGEHDEAIRAFELFAKRYPQSQSLGLVRIFSGEAHFNLKNFDQALNIFSEALKDPNHEIGLLANLWIGRVYSLYGEYDRAIEFFAEALSPEYPEIDIRARAGLAIVQGLRGKDDLARSQFERLFKLYAPSRDSNQGYLPALFQAAQYYDQDSHDAELAARYYQEFLDLAGEKAMIEKLDRLTKFSLANQLETAKSRLAWLKKNYLDYR